jgi:hypothetical protein
VSGSAGATPISTEDLASSAGATLLEGPSHEQACALIQPACQSYFDKVLERFWPPRCHHGRGI